MTTFPLSDKRRLSVWGLGRDTRSFLRWLRLQGDLRPVFVIDDTPASIEKNMPEDLGKLLLVTPGDPRSMQANSLLIKSPGVSLYRTEVAAYQAAGVELSDTISLWLETHPACTTIGISGTKGKSTSASMLAHIYTAAGTSVALAGNIGIPIFDVPDTTDCLILELSSYQTAILSQHLDHSILLNCYQEHLDWHGSFAQYRRDKFRMLTQTRKTISIPADSLYQDEFHYTANEHYWGISDGYHLRETSLYFQHDIVTLPDIPLTRGRHTLMNLAALCTSLRAQGIVPEPYLASLSEFQSLPHRLEHLPGTEHLHFINDSIATIPEAVMAALDTTDTQSTAVLIGGFNRGLDWKIFAEALINKQPVAVIGIPETGHLVVEALNNAGGAIHAVAVENLDAAVTEAVSFLEGRGTILLSPGAPSYGSYTNYQERGDHFRRLCERVLTHQPDAE